MTLFDLFVFVVMALSVLFGALRGLSREVITLVALCGGVAVVGLLAVPFGGLFGNDEFAVVAVLALLFGVGFLVVHVALEVLARRLVGAAPRPVDKRLGAAFGFLRGWFLCGLTFLTATYYFEAAALPEVLDRAWTRGFAAASADALDRMGVDGDQAPESLEETL